MITEVVAALIWDRDQFMICQRPAHKARGLLWEFVGGKVEPGETFEPGGGRDYRRRGERDCILVCLFVPANSEMRSARRVDAELAGNRDVRELQVRQAPAEVEDAFQLVHHTLHKGPDVIEHIGEVEVVNPVTGLVEKINDYEQAKAAIKAARPELTDDNFKIVHSKQTENENKTAFFKTFSPTTRQPIQA